MPINIPGSPLRGVAGTVNENVEVQRFANTAGTPFSFTLPQGAWSRSVVLVSGTAYIDDYVMVEGVSFDHSPQSGHRCAALTITVGPSSVIEYAEAR